MRVDRGRQSLVGQEWRVHTTRELSEVLERVGHVALELLQHPVRLHEVLRRGRAGELQPDGQGDELLLRAVVQVPLEASSFLVLCRDQPLARGAEILDQLGVREHEPGLRGQVGHELFLHGGQGLVGRLRDGEQTEELPLMADGHRGGHALDLGRLPAYERIAVAIPPFVGHTAAGRTSSPTRSQTAADVAPVPSARSRDIRTRMSSPE